MTATNANPREGYLEPNDAAYVNRKEALPKDTSDRPISNGAQGNDIVEKALAEVDSARRPLASKSFANLIDPGNLIFNNVYGDPKSGASFPAASDPLVGPTAGAFDAPSRDKMAPGKEHDAPQQGQQREPGLHGPEPFPELLPEMGLPDWEPIPRSQLVLDFLR